MITYFLFFYVSEFLKWALDGCECDAESDSEAAK